MSGTQPVGSTAAAALAVDLVAPPQVPPDLVPAFAQLAAHTGPLRSSQTERSQS